MMPEPLVYAAIAGRAGGHDHAVGAVSALRRLFGDEGGLHPVERLGRAEAFESGDAASPQPNFAPWGPSAFRKT